MNLKVFSQNFPKSFPKFSQNSIRHKRILQVYPAAKFNKTYWQSGLTNIIQDDQARILLADFEM